MDSYRTLNPIDIERAVLPNSVYRITYYRGITVVFTRKVMYTHKTQVSFIRLLRNKNKRLAELTQMTQFYGPLL